MTFEEMSSAVLESDLVKTMSKEEGRVCLNTLPYEQSRGWMRGENGVHAVQCGDETLWVQRMRKVVKGKVQLGWRWGF